MKLEMADFPVREVLLGQKTRYQKGNLEVSEREILELLLEDERIVRATIEVAHPGESCRITGIRDAVEPMVKVSGSSSAFPGVLGSSRTAGQGRTHRLSGMTVMPSVDIPYSGPVTITAPSRGAILDMSDHVAQLASTINLVLPLEINSDLAELEQHQAIQLAECKVAQHLAQATVNLAPEMVTTYELGSVDPGLPKVVITQQLRNHPLSPETCFFFYGMPMRDFLPTWVHPNELLDGALTMGTVRTLRGTTWEFCNHPVVSRLYARHGREVNFLGVILARSGYDSYNGKEHVATQIAKLAQGLGAQGALVCGGTGSGHPYTEVMLTVQACEQVGIRVVHLTMEGASKEDEPPLLFTVPEADAIVSLGRSVRKLSEVERVIGPSQITLDPRAGAVSPQISARASTELTQGMQGLQDHFGMGFQTCTEF